MAHSVEHDLELTTSALESGVADLGEGGTNEIDRWVQRLEGSDYTEAAEIRDALTELRAQVTSGSPDAGRVSELLRSLSVAAKAGEEQADDDATRSRLRELAGLLDREAGSVRQG